MTSKKEKKSSYELISDNEWIEWRETEEVKMDHQPTHTHSTHTHTLEDQSSPPPPGGLGF